jgi:hypothetical protein
MVDAAQVLITVLRRTQISERVARTVVIFSENILPALLMKDDLQLGRRPDIIGRQLLNVQPERGIINSLPPFRIKFYLRARKIRGDHPRPY